MGNTAGKETAQSLEAAAQEEERAALQQHRRRKVPSLKHLSARVLARHLNDIESFVGVGEELVLLVWQQAVEQYHRRLLHHDGPRRDDEGWKSVLTTEARDVVLEGLADVVWPWAVDLLAFSLIHTEGYSEKELVRLLAAAQPIILNNSPLRAMASERRRGSEAPMTPDRAEEVFRRFRKSPMAYLFCEGGTKRKKNKQTDPPEARDAVDERFILRRKMKRHYYYQTNKWQIRPERRNELLALIGFDRMEHYIVVLRCCHAVIPQLL